MLSVLITASDGGGVIYSATLLSGTTFEIQSSAGAGQPFVGGSVTLNATLLDNQVVNTTCSAPMYAGSVFGNFKILGGVSMSGKQLCCQVMETTLPVISNCPGNINVTAAGTCPVNVTWTAPTVSDNCGVASFASTHAPGSAFGVGTTPVTYTAIDNYGNTATCTFNVVVNDNTPPVFSGCPTDMTASANASCQAVVTWTPPTATDVCPGAVNITSTHSPGATFPLGQTTVTYTATDLKGNSSTCSFKVTVVDNTAPVFAGCPTDITVSADASCQAVATWTAPTATDNCPGTVNITSTHTSGNTFPLGQTTVTYTATDFKGNSSTCSFKVTVVDNTAPVFAGCPTDITVSANASCQAVVTWTAPTATDNCPGTVNITSTHTSGNTFSLGETTVTYTATDVKGNSSTCSFKVTVVDNTAPVFAGCPTDLTVSADASCQAMVTWTAPTATDNCPGTVNITSTHTSGNTFPLGETTVTYTATDVKGNSATCSFKVTVVDNTAPVFAGCPTDLTVSADASCQAVVTWTSPTATDNCPGTVNITSTHTSGNTFPLGETTVTYTATDVKGNSSTCSFKVTVVDNTVPVFAGCPTDITVSADASCQAVVTWTAPTATDNCPGTVNITSSHSSGATFALGETTVTYTATDVKGNNATCSFKVTVVDDTAPVFAGCPTDMTVSADASCQAMVTWTAPTATDHCPGTVNVTTTHNSGNTFPLGETTVTYTAVDAKGNTSTCSFKVTVVDDTAPVFAGCPTDITVSADASCQAVVTWTAPTASDNCPGTVNITSTHTSGNTFALGETTVTYTATDVKGNSATCSFKVTVVDDTAPVFSGCPTDMTVSADAACQAVVTWTAPTATDNCPGTVNVTSTHSSGATFALGETMVIYTAVDAKGNTSTCSFKVTVVDNTAPVLSGCPADMTVSADAGCQAVVTWTAPTATDNCPGTVNVTSTHASGATFPSGETTVTYTAVDVKGNTSTCSFKVTVVDNTAPVFAGCPTDMTVSANASCQAVVMWTAPMATDNCPGTVNVTSTHSPGATFALGETTVTYTAADAKGNTSTCSFKVTVVDNTAPVLSGCLTDMTVSANASCQAVVTWTAPTATDNCPGTVNITSTHNSGDTFALGEATVTYTAVDAKGNTSTCSFKVTVVDDTAPVFAGCPTDMTVSADASCQAVVTWTPPTATDNCPGTVNVTSTHTSGNTFALGETTVTYTATDAKGNIATCSFKVTVVDNTAPVFAGCPTDMTVSANALCQAVVTWTAPTATDNCPGTVNVISSHASGNTFALGETTVTYTATDAKGNTATCSFKVTVVDNTAPVFAGCPTDVTVSANASCQAVVTWTAPTATDNCPGTVNVGSTHTSGNTFALGETTVTYTAVDAKGNTSTCSFKVTVVDNTAPVLSGCPTDMTVSADASCQAVVTWTAPTATDNCPGTVNVTSTHSSGNTFALGETTVTYTATDAKGNTSTCSFKVTVVDNTAPVFAGCPTDLTVSANASCQAVVTWTPPMATDNCPGTVNVTSTHSSGNTFALGETTVTYTATDAKGNTATCSFKVTVVDNTAPVFSGCPTDMTVSANASCQAVVTWTAPTATDNCPGTVNVTSSHSPGATFPLGETTVTYTATDAKGNTATCSFEVKVVDNTAPVFAGCLADMTVSANASCQAVVTWTAPTATDNCPGTVNVTSSHSPGATFPLGETTVTYTATDAKGNTSTCSFKVKVVDDTAPVFAGCPADITISANTSCQAAVTWTAPTATDNCPGTVNVTSTHNSGNTFPLGETTVTYTATDAKGNSATCSFKVTVVDNTAPVFTGCPTDMTVSANASCQAEVTWTAPSAMDNCPGTVNVTSTHTSGNTFPPGETIVTYTAMDAKGNTSTCSFKVTVVDDTAPVFTGCPTDMTVSADASCQAVVTWSAPTATDNCPGTVNVTSTHASGNTFPLGETTVTYTATDAKGNSSTCSFKVTVVDNAVPVFAGCPADITVSANTSCQAAVTWTAPTATDNCPGTVNITSTHTSGATFSLGETTVTYTATDAKGNTSTCSFKVTVVDNTAPVFAGCPTDMTVSANASCQAVVTWTAPTATDNCPGTVNVTSTHSSGATFPLGATTVTYTATDAKGNTSTCSFKVTVADNTAPVFTGCPTDMTVSANASCQAVVTWTAPAVTDNCPGTVNVTSAHTSGATFPLGETTVIYTATDTKGNTSTCSFKVTVVDDTAPVFAGCPADMTVSADASCQAVVTWTAPTAADNCPGAVNVTSTHTSGATFALGETTVTYTATDAKGNTSTCSFKVTVNDNTAPVFSGCPADITVSADASCQAVATWTAPTATDNCAGTVNVTSTHTSGATFSLGETTVTYTATDAKGNTATCSFKVTVVDNTAPVFAGYPTDITVSADASCQAVVTWTAPTATDNCPATVNVTSTHTSGDSFPPGETTVTYTATDAKGNTSTCSFKVTVVDNTAPVFTGCPADITVSASASCQAVVTWAAPSATDNCPGTVNVTSTHTSGATFPLGETTVTYTATDVKGNTSTCSFKVTVADNTAPVFAGCPADITVSAVASCQAVVTWTAPTATDNCPGTVNVTSSHSPGATFSSGETTVTYTAADAQGNTSTCSFKVIVADDVAPVFAGCPADVTVSANASCQTAVTWTAPTATDNCTGTVNITSTHNPGGTFAPGETTVTYTATDAAGNTTTCSFKVTVVDNVAPVFANCPSNITASAEASCLAIVNWTEPTVTDNCGTVNITRNRNPGAAFAIGTTTVTYTATDGAGNTATCSFTVTVRDATAPVFTMCPSSLTVSATASCEAVVTWPTPVATDNCTGTVNITGDHSSGDSFPIGTTVITYTARDGAGNTATCAFTVTVGDDTAPAITGCPADIVATVSTSCETAVTWTSPTVTDNCTLASFTADHNSGDVFPIGTTTVTYTATDQSGKTSSCSFRVIVVDETSPVISGCPGDISAITDETGQATVDWIPPTAAAPCGAVALKGSHRPGDVFYLGETEVEYTATDGAGNTYAGCVFKVTVAYSDIVFDIAKVITPDGDGINDQWVLKNIEKFKNNKVVVVDRWGGVVYSATGYNNENVVWNGTNTGGGVVPTGTYFYTISVKLGATVVEQRGFIELLR
ncbi:HYR domain-containing protein [Fulvivirgaceae bacterium PWU4]|uniref:HYR domain-containing protein n=1 Tax=Chryseosolibacter histidini TaxID=2782349 RepID=A0AAP2GNK0_9BACT|nr:HYR domain-containing protein [Chryseosolibacter histidini]MBT1698108.1 HYR domain-containing protein [Chryseosolibacter histidini]